MEARREAEICMAGSQGEVDGEVMVGVVVAVGTDPGIMIALVYEVEAIELVALTGNYFSF